MKIIILLTFLLSHLLALSVFAEGKEGGNGQLVVIPHGHSKPVPYEAVRAWETGKYLNFYRLPNINGTVEPRVKFNKFYAVHALEWLSMTKNLSPILYSDLIRAAQNTSFRIVNDYIIWQESPYPDGELDYKKYEKAAFYNGEIILSTPVMDNVGPLNGALTKEQNQGFIVVHELINAAYPNLTVAQKLNIGEALIRARIFNDTQVDFNYNLCTITPYFLTLLPKADDFINLIDELIQYEKNPGNITAYKNARSFSKIYAYRNQTFEVTLTKDLIEHKFKTAQEISSYLASMKRTLLAIGYEFKEPVFSLKSLQSISNGLAIDLVDLLDLTEFTSGTTFKIEGMEYITKIFQQSLMDNLSNKLNAVLKVETSEILIYRYRGLLSNEKDYYTEDSLNKVAEQIPDSERLGFPKVKEALVSQLFSTNLALITSLMKNNYSSLLCARGFCIDEARTLNYYKWLKTIRDVTRAPEFPFNEGDRFLRGYTSPEQIALYHVTRASKSKQTMMTKIEGGERTKYGVREVHGHNGHRTIYSITSNLEDIMFLK